MNKEYKKGVLEICVLHYISKEDRYGYQIVKELENIFSVKESTIYPILKRLNKDLYLETYLKESTGGPARKYYKLTSNGKKYLEESLIKWNEFTLSVNEYLK